LFERFMILWYVLFDKPEFDEVRIWLFAILQTYSLGIIFIEVISPLGSAARACRFESCCPHYRKQPFL